MNIQLFQNKSTSTGDPNQNPYHITYELNGKGTVWKDIWVFILGSEGGLEV